MTVINLVRTAAAAAFVLVAQAAWAAFDPVNDDTDIFLANPAFGATRPNILIFVDNTANWGQAADGADKFTHEKAALASAVGGLTDEFNVGLAMFTEPNKPGDPGAYIRFAVRQMTTTNRDRLVSLINALSEGGDRANAARWSNAMREMYQYYAGVQSFAGHNMSKRDFAGNTASNSYAADLPGNALSNSSSTVYNSPIIDGCQRNFIIFISNGEPAENSSSLAQAEAYLASIGGSTATIALSPSGQEGNWGDEYANFMSNSDCNAAFDGVQNVYTYTVDVVPGTTGQGPGTTALLKSMASKGKGKYFAVSGSDTAVNLANTLKAIFNEVQAVNSVFASTTLPVSVNVRGTNLNQVYIGVFRPDAAKSPRWLGNLKLYKLGVNTATQELFLADANGDPAENSSTGFISGSAQSFWTSSSAYWAFRDDSLNGVGGDSDLPDGDLVEKGGGAQLLRIAYPTDQSARNLYTCLNSTGTGLCTDQPSLSHPQNAFASANASVTAADLGAFISYNASSLTSSGTTATLVLGTEPNPAWSAGNDIKVAGASPSEYNGTFSLTSAQNNSAKSIQSSTNTSPISVQSDAHGYVTGDKVVIENHAPNTNANGTWTIAVVDANNFALQGSTGNDTGGASGTARKLNLTYTYTLAAALDANSAQASGTSHGLETGTLVTVSGTAGLDATDAVVTRLDANTFRYSRTAASGSHGAITVIGKKPVTSLTGSGIAATAVVNGHGYVTGDTVTISGANETAFNKTVTITVSDANSFTYSTSPDVISGATDTAKATATAHNLSSGQSNVFVLGNTIASYNGGPKTVTKIDNNSVTFSSIETLTGTGGVIGVRITNFSHPTTGNPSDRDVLTVTTDGNHNIAGPFPFSITITGANANYNGTFTISSAPDVPSSTSFVIRDNANASEGPNGAPAGTAVAGKPITSIGPIVSATGTIRSARSVSLSGVSALTTAGGAITTGRLADGDATARANLIAWVRGADNNENENPDTTPAGSDVRPSAHGDVLHSRPAVVNYNRYGDDNDIYAFYGGNDGVFRALKGGTALHTSGPDATILPGTERWGFIPREFFSRLKRLREQSPTISSAAQKDYFVDGSIGVYSQDRSPDGEGGCTGIADGIINSTACDKVYLYLSLRRGGDFVYALDVTDPAAPKLLWRKGFGDAGWELLGQTWSEPRIAKINASLGNAANPDNVVLIFGAGYQKDLEDVNPCLLDEFSTSAIIIKPVGSGTITYTAGGSCTISGATGGQTPVSRTKGHGILVVDAFDGTVVWQAGAGLTTSGTARAKKLDVPGMNCAMPSDVTVLDKTRNGLADSIYAGDTCGQVWRADISGTSMDDWTVTRVAEISSGASTDIANKRKFLFAPDLVFASDAAGNYIAVLLGTGDREHPFDTITQNAFYMFKDRDGPNSTSVKISGFSPAPTGAPITHDNPDTTGVFDATSAEGSNDRGWKIHLLAGEKVVSSAVTISGTTFFNTNQPSSTAGGGSCGSNLGIAREYQVGFADASATTDLNASGTITIADRSTIHAGGGYLPSPVPVVVEIDGKKYQAVISGTSVQTPPGLTLDKRLRSYWYKELD